MGLLKNILLVGFGGSIGCIARYLISAVMLPALPAEGIPWYTLLVNVVGSLLIGLLLAAEVEGHWHSLAAVGFCGGFTTFSAFSLELLRLLRSGHYGVAASYTGLSLAFSLAAVAAGFYLGTRIYLAK